MEAFAVAKARVLSGTGGIRIVREERRRRTVMMAHTKQSRERRSQNAQGEFFVDHACIDCDTCRWMAPEVFTRKDGQSAVFKQPTSEEERIKALQGVYHCGYHAENSFGGTSYLIVHPEGNILVDSPRYFERLAQKIEMLGGARYMFLTHEDDIGDHQKWSERLRCDRIFHTKDIEASTADVEIKLDGDGPWSLGNDFELIHTPGHTEVSHGRMAEFKDMHEKDAALEAFLAEREQASSAFV
ncbi:hypothetical protein Syun_018224 [Stephania yunnanensis]|uniref:Metallo-beta-lactamase domain-containing protein n=1 Tax=Stephania yunnanensis TaxID=152371 RepID=A0AAP0NUT7_9MAGN